MCDFAFGRLSFYQQYNLPLKFLHLIFRLNTRNYFYDIFKILFREREL